MSKSKDKAYAHETRISRLFTQWSGLQFMRVPASGAMRWAGGRWVHADVVPPEGLPILIECKHHADLSTENLLIEDNKLVEWWAQTLDAAKRAEADLNIKVFPCMIFKRDYSQDFMAMPTIFLSKKIRGFTFEGIGGLQNVTVVNLKKFLDIYTPEDILTRLRQLNIAMAA